MPPKGNSVLSAQDRFLAENSAPDWLQDLRCEGGQRFALQGLPTTKRENWKYTDIALLTAGFGATLSAADVVYTDPDGLVQNLATVYEDGAPDWLKDLQMTPPDGENPLWDLCNAYIRDGLMLDVPAGDIHDTPLEITISGHDGAFFVPRTAYRLRAGAELTIIERHRGQGRYWNNRLTQIIVGAGAKLRHIRLQENSAESVYTQNTHVRVEEGGSYEAFNLVTGGALSRQELQVDLVAQGAQASVCALNLLRGAQIADHTVTINHMASHCQSEQLARSVLDERARGIFQGKAYVARDAQKTDARQMSRALLLSEGAEMDMKPELEIYADDVKCAHGATCGQLDDEALFYLRSRGIPEEQARALLIEGFVDEMVDNIGDKAVRSLIGERIAAWLS